MNKMLNRKKQPFKVPEGYFENNPEKILRQINELPPLQNKIPVLFVIKRQVLVAAAFIGFFLLSYGIYKFVTLTVHSSEKKLVQQNSYEEILLAKVDEYDIIHLLTEENIEKTTVYPEVIESYLIDEEINEQTINENINP